MKNLFLFMAITLVGLGGCSEKRSQPLAIDNSLTQEEIAAGVLSPEVMWKMGRVGLARSRPTPVGCSTPSPGTICRRTGALRLLYVRDAASGEVAQLTDFSSNNSDPNGMPTAARSTSCPTSAEVRKSVKMAADDKIPASFRNSTRTSKGSA